MKILQINKFSTMNGGSEVVADIISRAGSRYGHEVLLAGYRRPGQSDIFDVRHLGSEKLCARHMFFDGDAVSQIVMLAREFKPDAILHHNIYHHFPMAQLVDALSKELGVPQSIILHDFKSVCPVYTGLREKKLCTDCSGGAYWNAVLHRCKDDSFSKSFLLAADSFWNASRGKVYHKLHSIISPSRFLADNVRGIGGGREIKVLSNPCPEIVENSGARDRIVYAGRLAEGKGVDVLLRLVEELPQVRFDIAGDGPLGHKVAELSRWCANLHYLGRLLRNEVGELLGQARFVLVPSTVMENNPMVALEALARGIPILGSDRGGIPELVEAGRGFLFEPNNSVDVREVVLKAWNLTAEEWLPLSDACYEWARSHDEEHYFNTLISHLI